MREQDETIMKTLSTPGQRRDRARKLQRETAESSDWVAEGREEVREDSVSDNQEDVIQINLLFRFWITRKMSWLQEKDQSRREELCLEHVAGYTDAGIWHAVG